MLTFGTPAFLWALLALGVPVVAHLVNRERALRRAFPSIRFIDPSRLPRQGRRRLSDWLLLLLRLLLYSAVILVLARPRWVDAGADAVSVNTVAPTVILVDASASMGHRATFRQTGIALEQFLDGLPENVPVGLVVADDAVRVSVAPTLDRAALRSAWQDAPLGLDRAGRPGAGLAESARLLRESGGDALTIVSDFQAGDWQRLAAPGLPAGARLDFVEVGPEPWENVALLGAQVYPARDGSLRVYARVRNDAASAVPVELAVAGTSARGEAELAPGETQLVTLTVPADALPPEGRAGEVTLRVRGDESWPEQNLYAADDTYHLWLGAPPPTRVRVLPPVEEEPAKMREVAFVGRALGVGEARAGAHFDFGLANPREPGWLDEADVLYLPGTGAYFDDQAWSAVESFVRQGGTLFVTAGRATPRLFRGLRESGLGEAAYVGKPRRAAANAPYRVGALPENGPLARTFDADSRGDLDRAEIYEYWRVRPGEATEVLLATEDGDPLLMRERHGRGTVLISALALDPDASDLPLRNAFVPLLWESLRESGADAGGPRRLTVGEVWPSDLPPLHPGEATGEPGAWLVGGTPVAVNVSRAESLPARVALTDLRARLAGNAPRGASAVVSWSVVEAGMPLWPACALLAALALVMESVIARAVDRREALAT